MLVLLHTVGYWNKQLVLVHSQLAVFCYHQNYKNIFFRNPTISLLLMNLFYNFRHFNFSEPSFQITGRRQPIPNPQIQTLLCHNASRWYYGFGALHRLRQSIGSS